MKRRTFLLSGLALAGGGAAVVVGWSVLPPRQRLELAHATENQPGSVTLNGWVSIAADGMVSIAVPRCEMGQGVHTTLPMLLAEEMDCDWGQVRVVEAPNDKIFGNVNVLLGSLPFHPDDDGTVRHLAQWMVTKVAGELALMITGGSSSTNDAWLPMRQAGAAARAVLIAAAARKWGVSVSQCSVANGVIHAAGHEDLPFGALVAELSRSDLPKPPDELVLKQPASFSLIGKPLPRRDAATKVNGTAIFGLDVRLPDMLYAAVHNAPVLGSGQPTVDGAALTGKPGIHKVMTLAPAQGQPGAVVVIADHYWQARSGLESLKPDWGSSPQAGLSSASLIAAQKAALDEGGGHTYYSVGAAKDLLAKAGGKRIDAEYHAPYLAHVTMEPINCTAQVTRTGDKTKVEVWAPTQIPTAARIVAARVAGVSGDDVTLHVTYIGGGFGRRLEVDYIAQAVAIARETDGKPVQMIWSREEDVSHDYYRPLAQSRFSAMLGDDGKPLAFVSSIACDAITPQQTGRLFPILAADTPDKTTAEGTFDMRYEIPNQHISHVLVKSPVNIGFWRSVGHSYNAFFKESFIDELAHAAGKDPYVYRRNLLDKHPAQRAVLDLAARKHGWDQPVPAGSGRGIALHESFGSTVAQVVEATMVDGRIRVTRVTCAVDCGTPINPNIIRQQLESAVIFGLSAALYGEITWQDGKVQQSNFSDYPVVRIEEAPDVAVHVVPSTSPPTGLGEPGLPPLAPALANALFALTGKRLRSLPLKLA